MRIMGTRGKHTEPSGMEKMRTAEQSRVAMYSKNSSCRRSKVYGREIVSELTYSHILRSAHSRLLRTRHNVQWHSLSRAQLFGRYPSSVDA